MSDLKNPYDHCDSEQCKYLRDADACACQCVDCSAADGYHAGAKAGAAAERERIWRGVRALIWMVERHPTKDVIFDAHIRRLARDLKADLTRDGAYAEEDGAHVKDGEQNKAADRPKATGG